MVSFKELIHNKNLKDGSLFVFFSFLNQGLNFLLLIVLSWYIAPDSFGKLNLYYTGINIVSIFICLNTSGIISVNFYKFKRHIISQYVNTVLSLTLIVSVLLSIGVLLFHNAIEHGTAIEHKLQFLCIYTCATTIIYNILTDIYRLEEKVVSYGSITVLSTIINICSTLFLVISLKQDWYGRVFSNALTATLFAIVGVFLLIRKGYLTNLRPDNSQYKETLKFGIPLIPHGMNGWLRQGVDRYIINGLFNATQVGLFSFSVTFSTIIYSIGAAFNKANSAYIFRSLSEDPEGTKQKLRKQTFLMIGIFAIITLLLNLICIIIFPLAFPQYKDAIIFLFPLTLGAFFQCVYLQFCNFIFFFKKTKELMYMTFSVSLIHIVLSLWLTHYSVVLTAYVSMISSFIEATLIFWYSRKLYRVI